MSSPIFNQVNKKSPNSNGFDLSHEVKLSTQIGKLTPILCQPVLPGDRWRVNSEQMLRFAPMLAPIMHRVNTYVHYFFVPTRLVWKNFPDWMTGGEDGSYTTTFPQIVLNEAEKDYFKVGSLANYMGLPVIDPAVGVNGETFLNGLPFRANALIYNEYYRDQNLEAKIPLTLEDTLGVDEQRELLTTRYRAWKKDYFTSALPWAQKSSSPVTVPITPIYDDVSTVLTASGDPTTADPLLSSGSTERNLNVGGYASRVENLLEMAMDVIDLRKSARLQEWLELIARAGGRYKELVYAFFNEVTADSRVQRPEYLGGGKSNIMISEVFQTAGQLQDTNAHISNTPQGTMSGNALGLGNTNTFKKRFTEHGYVIGIMSILPQATYMQGIPKDFLKSDKYEFYWPQFAHIGEQEIDSRELYFDYNNAPSSEVFGYTPRYAEYKYIPSRVAGEFATNLNYWHLGRQFDSKPLLNEDFVQTDPEAFKRIFAVTDAETDDVYVQIYNRINAIRKMPKFGIPYL